MTDPPMGLLLGFQEAYPSAAPKWIVQAPGREMWVAALIYPQPEFTITITDLEAHATFSFRSAKVKKTVTNRPLPRWARYPAGVLLALRATGLETTGLQAVLAGLEPPGPRYEYALGLTIAALCYHIHHQSFTAEGLIELVDRVRRDYVEV